MDKCEILLGYQQDYERLFKEFKELNTFFFPKFADLWRKFGFSFIYAGRSTKQAALLAVDLFDISKKQILQSHTLAEQIFNTYLLYGYFLKQSECRLIKITLTCDEWMKLKERIKVFRKEKCISALYVIYNLIYTNAFEFCVSKYFKVSCTLSDMIHEKSEVYNLLSVNSRLESTYKLVQSNENKYHSLLQGLKGRGITFKSSLPQNFTTTLKTCIKEEPRPPSPLPIINVTSKTKATKNTEPTKNTERPKHGTVFLTGKIIVQGRKVTQGDFS